MKKPANKSKPANSSANKRARLARNNTPLQAQATLPTNTLQVHHYLPSSRANGPGLRAVVWVQGCTLGCSGCFNPHTHPALGGQRVTVAELFAQISALSDSIEGVTISGGEPFQQADAVLELLQRLRAETSLSLLVFTGFTWEEVQRLPQARALLACIDVLIAGRYDARQRLAHGLVGSANKTVHFISQRYTQTDLAATPVGEIILTPNGDILISGIDPLSASVEI
jgi:anaerobic ribonucleoside-triphosphate reductase activating protein